MRRLAPILALAALNGTPVAAASRLADVRLPTAYEAPAGAAPAPAELDRWWLLFHDPALEALEDEAFRNAPDARIAAARVLEAKATRDSQIAQTLPTGNISGNISDQRAHNIGARSSSLFPIGGEIESESASLKISWELDLFGRLNEARKVAKASLAQTRFNIEGTRASLAASVADTYFLANGLIIQIDDARETVRIESELQRVAQQKADLGLGAAADADRIAGDVARAQAQLEDLESQLHAARRQLLILIGRGNAQVESLALPGQAAEAPPPPAAIPGELLARRPDVREAEARLKVEAGTARLRHLAIFPTFTILPQLGLSRNVQPSVSYNAATNTLAPYQQATSLGYWTWGGGVTVPFFDIPRLLLDAKAEDARTRQAAIAYEKTVQTAYGEAENALVNLAAGKRAATLLVAGEARAHRASDAAKTRYGMGLDDLTTALSAEQAWRATRSALTSERVQTLRRAVATYKALGGGWAYTNLAKAR
jgi:NodT family efflux transporter outer membrane factor (OMF) lipoprotein